MDDLIQKIGKCIERGKVNKESPYPPGMKGEEGADEYTKTAIEQGVLPDEILNACDKGMQEVGAKFSRNEVFVPELLMAAKAMNAVMEHLKPFFNSGNVKRKGTFIIGTVAGDLHDIGKNLVRLVIEGNGWEVIDLGVDVKPEKFIEKINEYPNSIVGLSALLTTTMGNMAKTVEQIKSQFPNTKIIVGGAPLTADTAKNMGADGYASNPQKAVEIINNLRLSA